MYLTSTLTGYNAITGSHPRRSFFTSININSIIAVQAPYNITYGLPGMT